MKQKTLQTQYNLIKEGKGNKEVFLKEAKRIFPNYIPNAATFNQAEVILSQKSIISETVWGVTTGRDEKPDWFAIFNENMNESKGDDEITALEKEASKYNKNDVRYKELQKKIGDLKSDKEYALPGSKAAEKFSESINEEAKAEEKKTSKEVTDLEEKNFDYKDKKNIDNVYGEAFLKGYYCEMKNPKNEKKTVEELKSIVAKNLAKDQLHYVKAGQFGEEGVGYTDELPGLKASKSDQMEKVKLKEGFRVEYKTEDGEKAKSRVFDKKEDAEKKEKQLVDKGIKQAKVVKLDETKESLKEYTDTDFSGQDTLMKLDEPSYEAEGAFEKFFPIGYASQDDAADALMAHDKSPIKARMGRYAPMFVHVQYHEFTDEAGEEYRVHQTQYYNGNFKDHPDFNPRVTVLTLTKLADPDVRLGEIVVKTDEYIKDLKNLNVGDRVSESEIVAEAKKPKKETIESKLAEIDKASNIVALEAKINAIAEMIESKSQRLEMVNEDSDLAEMMDKAKIKAIQKEIKELEKRKSKMEKLYEKSCGKKYQQQEIVDETQIEEDRKAKEYVMSIEDEDEREGEIKRMFGSDDEISEEKINNYE